MFPPLLINLGQLRLARIIASQQGKKKLWNLDVSIIASTFPPLWRVMLMLGGGWCLGLKRGESRWEREKEKREENINNEREEREIPRKSSLKYIYIYILQYCYNAILPLELHCSSIAKKFAILGFCNSKCWVLWGLKCQILFTFDICNPQCWCYNTHTYVKIFYHQNVKDMLYLIENNFAIVLQYRLTYKMVL